MSERANDERAAGERSARERARDGSEHATGPSASALLPRVATGIRGLDQVLEGGLLEGGVYLVMGPPGSGKTILANHLCFNRARAGHRSMYVTLVAENHARMLAHLRRMSFFDPAAIPSSIVYHSALGVLERDGPAGLLTALRTSVSQHQASVLVVDGVMAAEEAARTAREYKRFIQELQSLSGLLGCTTVLLSTTERPTAVRPELTVVDGIIELGDELRRLRSMRHLQVPKLRGAAPTRGRHTLEITDDGIRVRPRIEARREVEEPQVVRDHVRCGFGVAELDAMLFDGVPGGSVTMLLGPSGCGKSLLGLQFLAAGARFGEPGLYFGFYERPVALRHKCERVGIHLPEELVRLLWHRPVEGVIDVLGERLLDAVEELGARRLCLDGIHGFENAVDDPSRVREVMSALTDDLERRGVTTVYTVETPDLFGPRIQIPVDGVSPITHNVILFRHVEMDAELHRLISILKVRDSDYDPGLREFRVTSEGIVVSDAFASAQRLMSGIARPAGDAGGSTSSRARASGKKAAAQEKKTAAKAERATTKGGRRGRKRS